MCSDWHSLRLFLPRAAGGHHRRPTNLRFSSKKLPGISILPSQPLRGLKPEASRPEQTTRPSQVVISVARIRHHRL